MTNLPVLARVVIGVIIIVPLANVQHAAAIIVRIALTKPVVPVRVVAGKIIIA